MGVLTVIKDYGTELLNAVRDNDLKTFKSICEKHLKHDKQIAELCAMDIKHRPSRKYACPLILAARLEDVSFIRYMMEIGANPNFIHHSAYTTGKKDVITPLHIATDLNLIPTVNVLLNFNGDPNIPDHNDDSPFLIAIKNSNWMLMKMMLTKGGSPSIADKMGNAPLHIATKHGHLQMVKTLLKNNADLYQRGFQGAIPSHIAAREGHIHLIQVFCSADPALVNTKIPCFTDQREKAVIHLAAERGHAETVIALLDQFNADMNLRDSCGNTPLHCVVLHYYQPNKMRDKDYFYGTAKILVKYKTSVNEKNNDGQTALHMAAMNNYPKIVELLLSIGANAFAEDNNRMKPVDVVPESDTVSKQLLKTAMLNPKPPINASSLSLAQNSSFHIGMLGDINGVKTSFVNKSMLDSIGSTPLMKPKNIPLDASSMSIFAHNVKHHHITQSPQNMNRSSGPLKYHTNNRIHDHSYNHSRRQLHHRLRRDSSSSESNLPSVFSGSVDDLNWRGYKHYSHASSDDTLNNRRSNSRTRYKADESYYRKRRSSERSSGKTYKNFDRAHRTDMSYAIAKSSDRIYDKNLNKRGPPRKHANRGDISESIYSDEDGIKVHKFRGKPKTIEVEYMSGPITIEFENQDQRLQPNGLKSRKQKKRRKPESPEENKRRDMDGSSKEMLSDWFNEMTKYNKTQTKKRSNLINKDDWDEDENSEKVSNGEAEAFDIKKPFKKPYNKTNFRQMKQRQYEEQLEIEKIPIADPEPPAERLKVIDDDSFSDDSSFDSESFEEKINDTQKVLNDSASKRIFEVMQNVQSKWSQDESGEDKNISKTPLKKPFIQKISCPALNISSENKPEKLFGNNLKNNYQSNLVETLKNEIIKMETVAAINQINKKMIENKECKQENGSISTSDVESRSPPRSLNMRISGETPKAYTRKGKASARAKFILAAPARIESSSEASDNEQSFASQQRRNEWTRPLTPIHISPRNSHQFLIPSINDKCPEFQRTNSSQIKPYRSFGTIETKTDALELTFDDVDDESRFLETSFNTEPSTDVSQVLSKIIPEKYQIKKLSKVTNLDDDFDEMFQDEEIQKKAQKEENSNKHPKTEVFKQQKKISKLRLDLKSTESFEDLLETYVEEPNARKPKSDFSTFNKLESKTQLPKKKKKIKKFDLPEGLSPEVWEEASKTSPLASSDTYASAKNVKKTRHLKTNTRNLSVCDDISNLSQASLDISVPLISNASEQSYSFSTDQLDVDIPSLSEDKKEIKKTVSNKDKNMAINTHEVSDTSKHFYLKKNKIADEVTERKEGRRKQIPSIHSGKVRKPPKPLTSHLSKPLNINESNEMQSVDDLNELPFLKKDRRAIPKYPNRPYDVYRMAAYSDTEINADNSMRNNFHYIHSEAETSDFELPKDPKPGTSYKEAALHSLNSKILEYQHKTLLLRQPGHHDKNFNYLRKLYHPRRRKPRVRSAHLYPTAGKYGHRELQRVMSNISLTESESEIDPNKSFITDDEFDDRYGSNQSLTSKKDKKISPIYESLMRYKRLKHMRLEFKQKETEPIGSLEPKGVNLGKYDYIARIWMEQVDKKTVLKSNTMYFKVLPQDQRLPKFILDKEHPPSPSSGVVPQWVIARTRFIHSKEAKDKLSGDLSFNEGSLIHRHLILFFKIGIDWMELAWVLFDGLSTESEVVRMIKDIQIKHPSSLSEQVEDLMRRWWHKKGDSATIQELQRALDLIQMFYIQEEIINRGDNTSTTFIKYLETEDDLDTGEVDCSDPNVSHLCQDYNSKSLNNSFASHSLKSIRQSEEFTSERVMRKIQIAKTIQAGTNEILARVSRPSSRSQDLDRSISTRDDNESLNLPTRDIKEKVYDDYDLLKKKKKSKHETNL